CGTLGRGALLSEQKPEIRRRLSVSPTLHAIAESTRLDAVSETASEEAVPVLVSAADETDPFAILGRAAEGLLELTRRRRDRARTIPLEDISRMLLQSAPPSATLIHRALGGKSHHLHHLIVEHQQAGGLYRPDEDPRLEVGRFVR